MAIEDSRRGAPQVELYEYRRQKMTAEEKEVHDAKLTDAEKAAIPYIWEFWARPNQLLPDSKLNWQTWLIMAGRGFGKTRTGGETVRQWIKQGFNYVNIIAPTADDARDVCIEGESGILRISPRGERPEYVASARKLSWPNGAISLIFTADEPERLRGKQHMKLWCDELGAWRYLAEAWDQAMLGLRLGRNPQAVVTTTPRPLKPIKELVQSPLTFLTRGTSYENRKNLAPAFYSRIITKYEGTRLGRQELEAELLEDRPGALFHDKHISDVRVGSEQFWRETFPHLVRVVGGIDPATTASQTSDETGVIFAGVDAQEPPHFYVIEDRSGVYSPERWADAAVRGFRAHKADKLVAETNAGGDMVISTLHHADPNVPVKKITASRGKLTRAEPIAALYEQRRVHHVGQFKILEDQMCDWEPGITEDSPDRMDALVWALTELSENASQLGLLDYLKTGVAQSDLNALETLKNASGRAELLHVAGPGTGTPGAAGLSTAPLVCPVCSGAQIQQLSPRESRCQGCGHQWWKTEAPAVFRARRDGTAYHPASGGILGVPTGVKW
jgi:phage terminase large subunit-like protein